MLEKYNQQNAKYHLKQDDRHIDTSVNKLPIADTRKAFGSKGLKRIG